jgi:selenocysteine lyase/cysteine desulfurase
MSDVANELLECGTSLAELEYAAASADEVLLSQPTAAVEHKTQKVVSSIEGLRDLIASDVLTDAAGGNFTTFDSPFPLDLTPGAAKLQSRKLPLVYCDQTASNRPVKSVEEYLAKVCLPLYGNTHTNTSITGSQSTAFVAEARQIVAEETNAKITGKASLDVVLFAGQGATSAVELLIDCLGITYTDKGAARPVVFVGPYEHHSCMIPFRESGCEVVTVPESTVTKQVDVAKLEELLQRKEYQGRLKMGTFTAASNVTGKVCNVDEISAALHRHGALAFFDYATAAPYVKIDMNPPPSTQYPVASLLAKDAVFLSPHKMLGGVGAPGVLIIKKHLVSQYNPPKRSGGGTVFYVTNTHHRFLSNRIERYEGGSPNVPGIIRVGLAFLLKRKAEQKYAAIRDDEVSSESDIMSLPSSIEQYDYNTHDRVALYLKQHAPNIVMLDRKQNESRNLPIFSFLIRFGNRFLHYNYVCAVLNDVFGIQSRGGCQCAGPYSQSLLGLTDMTADGAETPNQRNVDLEEALIKYKERAELLRPGFTRLSLPFKGLKTEEVDYVIKALEWTSKHGWALLCQYRCNHRTGEVCLTCALTSVFLNDDAF